MKNNRVHAAIDVVLARRPPRQAVPNAIETALSDIPREQLTRDEEEAWMYFWGTAAYQRGDRNEALARFSEAEKRFPESGRIAFSLAQEREYRGEVEQAFALFDRAGFVSGNHAKWAARFAYLWNEAERGFKYLSPVIEAYRELQDCDETRLFVRQLPSVDATVRSVVALKFVSGALGEAMALVEGLQRDLKNTSLGQFRLELECLMKGDFTALLARAERASEMDLHGMETMRAAVLKAKLEPDSQEARRILEGAVVPRGHWLGDVRLAALGEVAGREGKSELETRLRQDFMAHQERLLEPEWAVYFNLLVYQEGLKAEYRKRRMVF